MNDAPFSISYGRVSRAAILSEILPLLILVIKLFPAFDFLLPVHKIFNNE